jgi:hypothetical protein
MKTIVVYGGRFHPFHKGHFATYQHLTKKYGADSVYVVSSAKQEAGTSPFSFADKYYMMLVCGVQVDHIVQVVSPYQPKEITGTVDQENTRIIFALSAKDAERFTFAPKKDGSPSYMQPLPKNLDECNPLSQSGYVDIVPVVTFQILGTEVTSASEIRKLYIEGNVDYRQKIITELYGRYDPKLYDIFNNALLPAVAESFKYARMLKYIKESMPTATTEQKKEFVRLLESTKPTKLIFETTALPYTKKGMATMRNYCETLAESRHPELASHYAARYKGAFNQHARLLESVDPIVPYINTLQQFSISDIKQGDNLSVLQFMFEQMKQAEVTGSVKAKEVTNIRKTLSGEIMYIQFADGTQYPETSKVSYAGYSSPEYTIFTESEESAKKVLTYAITALPAEWELHDLTNEGSIAMGKNINEAPIEMDKEEPNDPMVYAPGTNPGKLSYRKQRAIAQLNALNEFAKAGQWDRVVQLFPELQMNVDAVRHGMEELQKVRSRGGINSRGINP